VLAFGFRSVFVPETKGKSLEDVERHWIRLTAKPPEDTFFGAIDAQDGARAALRV